MTNAKDVVARGYDNIADQYLAWAAGIDDPSPERYTRMVEARLPDGAQILDLGCGAGLPTAKRLAARFAVTGVDISASQIQLARQHVPTATFIQADMAGIDLPANTFDAVVAFYSLTHVPRAEQSALLRRIANWLTPGGLLVATVGAQASDGIEANWLGAPMYFSHFDAATNRQLIIDSGLHILSAEDATIDEHGTPATFHWIVAERPPG